MTDNSVADNERDVKQEYVRRVEQNFPQELQDLAQWVLYRKQRRTARNGKEKWDKIPFQPGGQMAKSNDPATWSSFEECVAAYMAGKYDGLMFTFGEYDPYAGFDADNCVKDGAIAPQALAWARRLDSYTEYSQSKKGIHAFVIGKLPPTGRKSSKHDVEVYDNVRFFAVTGDHVPGTPTAIEDRQAELEQLHAEIFPSKPQPHQTVAPEQPVDLDDQALLDKMFASKQGAKIRALWTGNTNGYGDDDSAADQALCNYLAFWTGRDAARMDKLFRQSGLFRDKWDRNARTGETYGEGTIRKALEDVREGYTNGRHNMIATAPAQGAHGPPPSDPPPLPPDRRYLITEAYDDEGNAQCVNRLYAGRFLHSPELGWLHYTGTHWTNQGADAAIDRAIVDTLRQRRHAAVDTDNEKLIKATSASRGHKNGAKDLLSSIVHCHTGMFDADPWLFNCRNGTVDLRTGKLRPHDAADLITRYADVEYNPDARCTLFLSFLDRIMAGNQALIDYIQRALGYSLTGIVRGKHLFFAYGGGDNGKTVLFEAVTAAMGDYWIKSQTEMLMRQQNRSSIPNDVARLRGVRMTIVAEVEEGSTLNESRVKDLTGGDTLTARFLQKEFFDFEPTHKLWMYGNHKPVIKGKTTAIWERVKLIPFLVTIPKSEQDPQLKDKLIQQELSGILAWLVAGCIAWQRSGLGQPDEVTQAVQEYRIESDTVAKFVGECCIMGEQYRVRAKNLRIAYEKFCEEFGYPVEDGKKFWASLEQMGVQKSARLSFGYQYIGIGLLETEEEEGNEKRFA